MGSVRPCRDDERAAVLSIVNAAAEAYRGVIPLDRWHDPYMPEAELNKEIASGIVFWGYEENGALIGVMGLQSAGDVDLIRHAYVLPDNQRGGIGGALLNHLRRLSSRRMLVGTWQAANWAIRFYQRHGFELVSPVQKDKLLRMYWDVPDRQIETSVVLANPGFNQAPCNPAEKRTRMHFRHSSEIWRSFPELAVAALFTRGISKEATVPQIATFTSIAESRLSSGPEGQLPEIQAWRQAFSKMGLKPTQYRCASEALLRRFRKERSLPSIHPLVDLCNAISIAFAIPVAVFDACRIAGYLEVRRATGSEVYLDFSGQVEAPAAEEVIFADNSGRAHARRWSNRQSACSAVRDDTHEVLIVAEAMHESGPSDIAKIAIAIARAIEAVWTVSPSVAILNSAAPCFQF
jgi:DNA/RNA-binding domain of Phe-tRNA-synthetase-like protein/GNAT superfamily N-acetyltransferase